MSWLVNRTSLQAQGTWVSRYGTALIAVIVATLLRALLDPFLEQRVPYGFYAIATTIVAWRCGLGPALATIIPGVTLGKLLFEHPGLFDWQADHTALLTTLLLGSIIAVLIESLRWIALDNARLYQLARQSEARKDQFLAALAHELRNPLAPIRSAVYLLQNKATPETQMAPLHQIIDRQVTHLVRLVDDLLDVSRITQGKIELRIESVQLNKIIDAAVEIAHPLIEENGHKLYVARLSTPIRLNVDSVRMIQTFANLLNNAAKYTDRGGQIWLSAQANGNEVLVRVRDTGIGIAPEMQARIFDMFEQANQAIEHSRGGLGMGLTLARTLVEMHGGTVEAASHGIGLGSEFTVRLPIAASQETAPAAAAPAPAAPTPAGSAHTRKILIVDDNVPVAKTLEMVLKQWNYAVRLTFDGFAALESARAFQPDIVLTDLGLPQMNGYQLATELRRVPGMENVILIALSGYGQQADRERSESAGFARHLVKPVDLNELETTLAEIAWHQSKVG